MMKRDIIFFIFLIGISSLYIPSLYASDLLEHAIHLDDEIWIAKQNLNKESEIASVEYVDPEGAVYDENSFREAVREKYESHRIEPSLSETIQSVSSDTMVKVIVTLRNQPYGVVKEKVRGKYTEQLEELRNQAESMKDVHGLSKDIILKGIKSINDGINAEAYTKTKKLIKTEQTVIASHIESLGGKVTNSYTIINAISAAVPAKEIEVLSSLPEIARITEDRVIQANLNVSEPSIYADTWWNNGFTGGIYNAGILDCGMDTSHPAFAGKTFINGIFHDTALAYAGLCYDDDPVSPDDLNGHGTHVGGIVMSQGAAECPSCKGVAYGLNKTFNLKAAFLVKGSCGGGASMYFSDAMAAVDWAESQLDAPDVYNLSYSGETSSDYDAFAQFFDGLVSWSGKPVAIAAGNSGPNNTAFNSPANAYNVLSVANMNDMNSECRIFIKDVCSNDIITNSSSRGPTAFGRKKPDISAPGTMISSANASWEFDWDFVDYTGTSMAAPHVAGSFILLQNYMGSGIDLSLRQKALLINTADSWSDNGTVSYTDDDGPVSGKHWDKTYGWGYINLDKAYTHRNNTSSDSLTTTNRFKLYKGQLPANGKATVVWNRRPATEKLSNIDLYVRREADEALLDASISVIDNVEQVSPATTGDVVLKVKLAGSIYGDSYEQYGLAADGDFSSANFDVGFLSSATPFVCPGTTFNINQTIMNYGDIYSHNHTALLTTPVGWAQVTPNPGTLGSIQPNRKGGVVWSVVSPAFGSGVFSISGSSYSYGETFVIPTTTFDIGIKTPSFTDVSCSHPFYGWIEKMKEQRITSGCAMDLYCPEDLVTRKQKAVFIIRAMGQNTSAASYDEYFDDIADDAYAPYINRMYELGITAGCGTRAYCPESPVTRGEMAVFISKAKGWSSFTPASPTFSDVPPSLLFSGYIERIWRNGISSGCTPSLYCPESYITRGQMAVFIVRAF